MKANLKPGQLFTYNRHIWRVSGKVQLSCVACFYEHEKKSIPLPCPACVKYCDTSNYSKLVK